MKGFIEFINRATYYVNLVSLSLLAMWVLLGVWGIVDYRYIIFWQAGGTLAAIVIFTSLLSYISVHLYRRNLKLINLFRDSDYTLKYKPGDIVFHEGAKDKVMYLVIQGEVELVSGDKVLEVVDAGGIFGEMAIIENLPRSAAARCKTSCKLVAINQQRFYSLIQEIPFFATEVMKAMSHRLRNIDVMEKSDLASV